MQILHAEIKDGVVVKFPYGEIDLIADNPYTNFKYANVRDNYLGTEKNLQGLELVDVLKMPQPQFDFKTQVCEEGGPELTAQGWVLGWVVRQKTPDEVISSSESQAADIRAERNRRLTNSDWTQVADAPVDKAAWATYRQALRDISAQTGFPWEVTWPDAP